MKKSEYETLFALEDTHWWYLGHRHLYAALIDRHAPVAARGSVLDAGCGTGGFTFWLRDRYRPSRIAGLDVSEEALSRCRERGLADLHHCPVEHISLPDASFDFVLSLNVIYHRGVGDELRALKEMGRVLVPGGYLLLNLPALSLLRGSHDDAVEGVRRYRAPGVSEMLGRAGFEPVAITYFVFTLLPAVAAYRLWSRIRKTGGASDLRLPPAPINHALESLLRLESRAAARRGLPLGSSLAVLARKK